MNENTKNKTIVRKISQIFNNQNSDASLGISEPKQDPSSLKRSGTWLTAGIAAATLEACGGGSDSPAGSTASMSPETNAEALRLGTRAGGAVATGSGASTTVPPVVGAPVNTYRNFAKPATDNDAARFLLQAQFSASTQEIESLRSLGYAAWLNNQFNAAPGVTAWEWLNQRGYGVLDNNAFHFVPYPIDFAMWYQLMKSPDGVRKRVALALSEIFSVSTFGVDYFWLCHLMAAWWDTLSSNALGNFRDLLENVTLNPAMGMYLNTRGSQKENAAGRQPDENFPREIMQLMTIGLVKLNPDGTMVTSGGVPIESYSQSDVSGLARVFTGYNFNMAGNVSTYFNGLQVPDKIYTKLPMALDASQHSTLEAKFLGVTIPAGTDGVAARKTALDTLFNHPNVGPFIGKQLIQRLVTSNPNPAYVARVAAVFANNGNGVRGDLAATVSAILLDDDARGPSGLTSPIYGHLREPMIRLVQWGRTFGLNSARGTWKLYDQSLITQLAQSPLRSPSVFNFFRPGYVPPVTAIAAAGLVAPEFQLINESSVSAYLNYMNTVLRNGIYVGAPDLPQITGNATNGFDIAASYTNELPLAPDANALVARLNLLLTAGQLSSATVDLIVKALNATLVTANSNNDAKLNRIASGVLLIMASSEYLIQK